MQAVLYTLFIIISITHSQRFDCDNDVAPDGPHTCAEQLDWGKCDASEYDWMLGYCCQSCGTQTCADCDSSAAVTPAPITSITPAPREQYVCDQDVQSGEEYTCAEQKGWDQCMEDWMEGWCCISCPDSCLSQCASPSTTEINTSNITNITNITIIMMQPTKPPLTTTQNVFTSMEEEQSMAPYTCDADVVPGDHTCEEQYGWGKCDFSDPYNDWMMGWCCRSCRDSCTAQCTDIDYIDYNFKVYKEEEIDFWIRFFISLNCISIALFVLIPACLWGNTKYDCGKKNLLEENNGNGVNKWYKTAIGLCLFLWFLNVTGTFLNIIIWNYTDLDEDEVLRYIVPLDTIRVFAWIIGKTIMFGLYIIRLHLAFKGSVYRYSFLYLSVLGIFLIAHTIFGLVWFYSLIIETSKDFKATERASNHVTLGVQILVAEEILLSLILIISFIRPLFKIVSKMDKSNMDQKNDMLLGLMAKYINLGIISVISSSAATIMGVVYSNDTDFIVGLFTAWVGSLDCVINGWCIILLLKSTHNIYLKLCICTHAFCMKCATKIVNRNDYMTQGVIMSKIKILTNHKPKIVSDNSTISVNSKSHSPPSGPNSPDSSSNIMKRDSTMNICNNSPRSSATFGRSSERIGRLNLLSVHSAQNHLSVRQASIDSDNGQQSDESRNEVTAHSPVSITANENERNQRFSDLTESK